MDEEKIILPDSSKSGNDEPARVEAPAVGSGEEVKKTPVHSPKKNSTKKPTTSSPKKKTSSGTKSGGIGADHPLSWQSLLAGLIITVLGGIVLAFIIRDARFGPEPGPVVVFVTPTGIVTTELPPAKVTVAPTATPAPRFAAIDLSSIANWPLDHLVGPPRGQVSLGGVPFTILEGERSIFQTQHSFLADLSTQGELRVSIANPVAVYVLLNGGFVERRFEGQKVGEVSLSFSDGSVVSTPIVAWQNIREPWIYEEDWTANPMSGTLENVQWENVFSETQMRDKPAIAFIDMIKILVRGEDRGKVLVGIGINDTSVETAGSMSPSLMVMGITVEAQ